MSYDLDWLLFYCIFLLYLLWKLITDSLWITYLACVYIYVCMYLCVFVFRCVYICISEKAIAPHSSTLAWKIPWMEKPGRLWSTGSLRVRHNWVTSLSLFSFMHWKRKWQPAPVFLPGESQGRGSLVDWRLWGLTEFDTTEMTLA